MFCILSVFRYLHHPIITGCKHLTVCFAFFLTAILSKHGWENVLDAFSSFCRSQFIEDVKRCLEIEL